MLATAAAYIADHGDTAARELANSEYCSGCRKILPVNDFNENDRVWKSYNKCRVRLSQITSISVLIVHLGRGPRLRKNGGQEKKGREARET